MFDTIDAVRKLYYEFPKKLAQARLIAGHPLTLTEKILYNHLAAPISSQPIRAKSYLDFFPDRIAMQDGAAQMALLQFALSLQKKTQVPTTIHCDHLIFAERGADQDLQQALIENQEIYDFLKSSSEKCHIGFWEPGTGTMNQVLFEHYAFPGGLLIGTDSHTSTAGGLGMLSVSVGGADVVDVMAGLPWELKMPKVIGVKLSGALEGWTSAKDVILKLVTVLKASGAAGSVIEYFGEGCQSISATGKATICNMGAEIGAVASIFPYDCRMSEYLTNTNKGEIAKLAHEAAYCLKCDPEVEGQPDQFYDQMLSINLSDLEPHVRDPSAPDKAWKLSEFADAVRYHGYPEKISAALIGSCANSSYEDMERAASVARQALKHGIKLRSSLLITPGSEQIFNTIRREGQLKILQEIGGTVFASAGGPCAGHWKRHDVQFGEKNSILASFNRNFLGHNDSNPGTHTFIASPEIVMGMALAGKLTFNPMTDPLITEDGLPIKLHPPSGQEFPLNGFEFTKNVNRGFSSTGNEELPLIDPESSRLQLLKPFLPQHSEGFKNLRVLAKVSGHCTTDHISPGGKWLQFRGHLDTISNNFLLGAVNAFMDTTGKGRNFFTGDMEPFPKIAQDYKHKCIPWVIIGDEHYGSGASLEHAAMEPRYLGGAAIIAKSFARPHEIHLKKQGMLAVTFSNPADYNKIQEEDLLAIEGLGTFAPGVPLTLVITHTDKTSEAISLFHSYNDLHIAWFKAGSSVNYIAKGLT
jgi:aconitate hydratase